MNFKDYPPNWRALSRRIRKERAGNRCEWCGAENYQPHPVTRSKVILTVAHLGIPKDDGSPGNKDDKFDVREANLAALCQRCHLNFDREDHLKHRIRNRRRRREKAGQVAFISLELQP
jgi:hypothetical protein